jgi:VanZ family protein
MGLTGALVYMILLGCGTIISPGVGIPGQVITLLPQATLNVLHLPAYGVLTWLLTSGLRGWAWPRHVALCAGGSAAFVFGVWMEIVQAFVPGRVVDIGDVWFNTMGIGTAVLLVGCRLLPVDPQPVFLRPQPLNHLN